MIEAMAVRHIAAQFDGTLDRSVYFILYCDDHPAACFDNRSNAADPADL